MGRPKLYSSHADRQAAYAKRQRTELRKYRTDVYDMPLPEDSRMMRSLLEQTAVLDFYWAQYGTNRFWNKLSGPNSSGNDGIDPFWNALYPLGYEWPSYFLDIDRLNHAWKKFGKPTDYVEFKDKYLEACLAFIAGKSEEDFTR